MDRGNKRPRLEQEGDGLAPSVMDYYTITGPIDSTRYRRLTDSSVGHVPLAVPDPHTFRSTIISEVLIFGPSKPFITIAELPVGKAFLIRAPRGYGATAVASTIDAMHDVTPHPAIDDAWSWRVLDKGFPSRYCIMRLNLFTTKDETVSSDGVLPKWEEIFARSIMSDLEDFLIRYEQILAKDDSSRSELDTLKEKTKGTNHIVVFTEVLVSK